MDLDNRREQAPIRHEGTKRSEPVDEFAETLAAVTGEDISVAPMGGTYDIDTDSFRLSFVLDERTFEIRNIESAVPGMGRKVITAIHEYADEHGLDVFASKVKATAQGFWREMGYQQGSNDEFFRAT